MSCRGTQFKFLVHLDPVAEDHLIEHLVECRFHTLYGRGVIVLPRDMTVIDGDNATCIVDSQHLTPGDVFCRVVAKVPDQTSPTGYRLQIEDTYTGLSIDP